MLIKLTAISRTSDILQTWRHGDFDIDPVSFFKFSTNCITRGHKYKLLKQFVCVDACKFSCTNGEYSLHGIFFQLVYLML